MISHAPDIPAWAILLSAALTHNILLVDFLGMCSFLGTSGRLRTALGMAGAVVFVMTATCMIDHVLYHQLLVPAGLEFLRLLVFILVIAGFVQLVELVIERCSETLMINLGIFLPLLTVNCAILGASLFTIQRSYTFAQAAGYGFGSAIGFALVLLAMAGIRERLATADIPRPLRGLGVAMIVTALMAMAFSGLARLGGVQ